jgi:hypothetical protein
MAPQIDGSNLTLVNSDNSDITNTTVLANDWIEFIAWTIRTRFASAELDWTILAATLAVACQIFALFLSRKVIKGMWASNRFLPFIVLTLMFSSCLLTMIGTLEKHFYRSEGFGEPEICIICGVVLFGVSLLSVVLFIMREQNHVFRIPLSGQKDHVAGNMDV